MSRFDNLFGLVMGGVVLPLALFFVLLILPLTGLYYFGTKYKCEAKATAQGMEWSYDAAKGCMVKTENGWVDYKRLIYIKGAK